MVFYQDAFQVYELLDKWNPLGPPRLEGLQYFLTRHPDAARQEFLLGQTLLHKCMEAYSYRSDLCLVLMDANPGALTKADSQGWLPLHRALMAKPAVFEPNQCSSLLPLVKEMTSRAPETVLETTFKGALPLHLACARQDHSDAEDVVQYLLDCFPESIQHRDNQGEFPLHYALFHNDRPRLGVLKILLNKYSVLLSFMDEEGCTLLHRILQRNHSKYDALVERMVQMGPGALRWQDQHGFTPLLLATTRDNSLSQIFSLVRAWPEQVSIGNGMANFTQTDFNGEMLSSSLSSSSARLDRLQLWLDRYGVSALREVDAQGRIPLHYAAVSTSPDVLKIICRLVEGDPLTCEITDQQGRLPLHYASASGNGNVVSLLLSLSSPATLLVPDGDGRLPWHYAECARLDGIYERTLEYCVSQGLDGVVEQQMGDTDLIPDEVRWDIVQTVHDVM